MTMRMAGTHALRRAGSGSYRYGGRDLRKKRRGSAAARPGPHAEVRRPRIHPVAAAGSGSISTNSGRSATSQTGITFPSSASARVSSTWWSSTCSPKRLCRGTTSGVRPSLRQVRMLPTPAWVTTASAVRMCSDQLDERKKLDRVRRMKRGGRVPVLHDQAPPGRGPAVRRSGAETDRDGCRA